MSIDQANAAVLGQVLDWATSDDTLWQPHDLGALLKHQLRAPLMFDTSRLLDDSGLPIEDTPDNELPIRSLKDLLTHPHPPVSLLELAKQFAKDSITRQLPVAREVAMVLYYAAIVAALVRCGRCISALDNSALLEGIGWALAQDWLDHDTRDLLSRGQSVLTRRIAI